MLQIQHISTIINLHGITPDINNTIITGKALLGQRGGANGRETDSQFTAHGFKSWMSTTAQWPWASYLLLCAYVTKQYNLLPAKEVIFSTGKVTVGLVGMCCQNSSVLEHNLLPLFNSVVLYKI